MAHSIVRLLFLSDIFCLICLSESYDASANAVNAGQSLSAITNVFVREIPTVLTNLSSRNCSGVSACEASAVCLNDTISSVRDYEAGKVYARQMFYSFGEISPEAEFTLNYKFLGNFDLCRDADPKKDGGLFSSKYCLMTMQSTSRGRMEVGVCFPNSCTDGDIAFIIFQATAIANVTSDGVAAEVSCAREYPYYYGAVIALFLCIILGIVLLLATSYDVWLKRYHVTSATSRVKTHDGQTNTGANQTNDLNSRCDNPNYILDVVLNRLSAQIYLNGYLAVDTFFVIGGMLVTYITLKHLDRNDGKLNWLLFLFHRVWRLTPVYMFVLMLWSTLVIHTGIGPRWHQLEYGITACQQYWWTNLLYINNFLHYLSQCMPWTWYLALDMQFHIVAPLFLITLHKRWKWGIGILASFCLISIITTATISSIIGHSADLMTTPYNNKVIYNPIGGWLYDKPYYRIQAYVVGIVLGFILYKTKNKNIEINKYVNVVLWMASVAAGLIIVLGLYSTTQGHLLPQAVAVLYVTFSKLVYGSAVAWVIFACHKGYGGPINQVLSWKLWIPLSRLTYCVYLIHPVMISTHNAKREVLMHYTDEEMIYFYIGVVSLSYMAAIALSLCIELPLAEVEKTILKKFTKKPKTSQKKPEVFYL
uniref:Nose resistant to fluoxetine protein 6-like n=1 Tax=Saccoglossus kowalevskii TaxID=10224 RepID=A0ABM0MF45_SACKO|nr:PREDICTED: nose resistant to fluoxetine protein 6-like [Saccoglossus kowalevskii]